jgi:hypothetical protein
MRFSSPSSWSLLQLADMSLLVLYNETKFSHHIVQHGTLSQLQLNLHNHVLVLCAFCKALFVSLLKSMSSTFSATVPSRTKTLYLQLLLLKLRMNALFSLWLLNSESNSSILSWKQLHLKLRLDDTEGSFSSFMEVTQSQIQELLPLNLILYQNHGCSGCLHEYWNYFFDY